MFRPSSRQPARVVHRSSSSCSSSFSCSSFKDIHHLVSDSPPLSSPRTPSIFHRVRLATAVLRSFSAPPKPQPDPPSISIPGSDSRVVIYFTSLRVVRSTFDDCRAVRSILRSFRVPVDERDLSMDSRFLHELQKIMGVKKPILPKVFIGEKYVGGAEEIKQMNETGELKKLLEVLPKEELRVCEDCGGYGFVLCDECSGSHKLYMEKGGFKTCMFCNENGLIRCNSCSSSNL